MKNKRWIYLAITSAIIVLGLASRKHGDILPEFIAEYSGDTLWAAMVYCGIRFLSRHYLYSRPLLFPYYFLIV